MMISEEKMMSKKYFTITGCSNYYGNEYMKTGVKVKLVKEPDNKYDREAIKVKIKGVGKVGYVANSPYTVKEKSMSAGRLYDKIGKKAKAKIVFILDGSAICEVTDDGLTERETTGVSTKDESTTNTWESNDSCKDNASDDLFKVYEDMYVDGDCDDDKCSNEADYVDWMHDFIEYDHE